jgi:hypothetical protein
MVVGDMRVVGLRSCCIHAVFCAFKPGVILVTSLAIRSTLLGVGGVDASCMKLSSAEPGFDVIRRFC